MLLVSEGKLHLDDPASKYLDNAPEAWQEITIRHLLTHTSGLVREAPGYEAEKIQSEIEVIKSAYPLPLRFPPGDQFEYCNLGYFILAEVIRRETGQPWPDFFERRVFKPHGMLSTRVTDPTTVVENRVDGYLFADGKQQNSETVLALRPSGAFMSSLVDLSKWNAMLDAGSFIKPESLEAMWTPVTLNDGTQASYGFGWRIDRVGSHRTIHHGGAISGFRAQFSKFPDDKLSVILLTNAELARSDVIALGIAAQFIPDLLPKRTAIRLSASALAHYAGHYQFGAAGTGSLVVEAPGLSAKIPRLGPPITFLPESPSSFFAEDDPRTVLVFSKDAAGRVVDVVVRVGDVEQSRGTRLQ